MIPGLRTLKGELEDRVKNNGHGHAKSFEEYRYNCGVIYGMERAIELMKGYADQLDKDD